MCYCGHIREWVIWESGDRDLISGTQQGWVEWNFGLGLRQAWALTPALPITGWGVVAEVVRQRTHHMAQHRRGLTNFFDFLWGTDWLCNLEQICQSP